MATKRKLIIALTAAIAVAIALTVVTAAVLSAQQNLPANGTIQPTSNADANNNDNSGSSGGTVETVNLDIYTDATATVSCTSIEWGVLNPGDSVSKTIYLKNTGNTAEMLNMTVSEWTPEVAGDILSLTWNKEGQILDAGTVMAATLTLHVPENPGSLTSFSLNIVISGEA